LSTDILIEVRSDVNSFTEGLFVDTFIGAGFYSASEPSEPFTSQDNGNVARDLGTAPVNTEANMFPYPTFWSAYILVQSLT